MKTPINPVWVYTLVANALALIIGLGVIVLTDVQQDLVLKFVASIILVITGVSIPEARAVSKQIEVGQETGFAAGTRSEQWKVAQQAILEAPPKTPYGYQTTENNIAVPHP